jgi:ubiquinol-cytochrome c reductase cytochrome b subunit
MGGLPVIGESVQTFAQGGSEYGNATLTRFYALHVFILPALLIGMLVMHVALFRRHGVTPSARTSEKELESRAGWFWPTQVLMDATFGLAILAILLLLTFMIGAPLSAPADPSSAFDARPEWYFLFLFQLLKYFEGPMILMGTVVIPGIATTFLVLLPFLDRGPDRRMSARKVWIGLVFAGLAGVAALTLVAKSEDNANGEFQTKIKEAERNAKEATAYAGVAGFGIDAHGKVVLYEGKKLFRREQCGECHELTGEGGDDFKAPSFNGFLSRAWLDRFLENPSDPKHFGNTKFANPDGNGDGMEVPDITEEQRGQLVEYLASLSGTGYDPPINVETASVGAKLFDDECTGCHTLDGTEGSGPTMKGYGSRSWLAEVITMPSAAHLYGELGDGMPGFDHLSEAEVGYLTAWLIHLQQETSISD